VSRRPDNRKSTVANATIPQPKIGNTIGIEVEPISLANEPGGNKNMGGGVDEFRFGRGD
jgi:hypothetical protein